MTPQGFTDALAIVLKEEGGFVDDARDPGGMTNLGVTARTWQAWTGHAVNETIMRGLTPAAVAPLYRAWFWDKIAGDALPIALALVVFDFAVNAGPARAAAMLQAVAGAHPDGQIGPATLKAVAAHDTRELVRCFSNARESYYRGLPAFPAFGKGWLARVERVEAEALSWLG